MYDVTHNTRTKYSGWRVLNYGGQWFSYKRNKMNTTGFNEANPRDQLFPPFGICDIKTLGYDVTSKVAVNKDLKFVCEITPHGVYTYLFLFLWVLCIIGWVLAMLGCVYYIYYCVTLAMENKEDEERFRTKYYLDYIKRTNDVMYKEVKQILEKKSEGISEGSV